MSTSSISRSSDVDEAQAGEAQVGDVLTGLEALTGVWKIVWVVSKEEGGVMDLLKELEVPEPVQQLFQTFPPLHGSLFEFSIAEGCWLEKELSFIVFRKWRPVPHPLDGTPVTDRCLWGPLVETSIEVFPGKLVFSEKWQDGSREVRHELEVVGHTLHRRITHVNSGSTFEVVYAKVDAHHMHRSAVLQQAINQAEEPTRRKLLAVLPAMVFYPLWFYAMSRREIWKAVFTQFYPMTVAMIVGSFIAGSTPLGGGVVGFPVAVLFLNFDAAQGRDFSAMIQSVGMTAASYLIIFLKPELVHVKLVTWSIFFGAFGLIVGFSIDVDGFIVNIILTTYLLAFGIAYYYKSEVMEKYLPSGADDNTTYEFTRPETGRLLTNNEESKRQDSENETTRNVLLIFSALLGGFFTSKLGSGADSLAYVFGTFCWNKLTKLDRMSESTMTASTVIIMATMSCFTVGIRLSTGHISEDVTYCWCAAAPVVCLGAPIGSLILDPSSEHFLRQLFYALSVVQFAFFAVLIVKSSVPGWIFIAVSISLTLGGIAFHYTVHLSPMIKKFKHSQDPLEESVAGGSRQSRRRATLEMDHRQQQQQQTELLSRQPEQAEQKN